jgi:hypothetical protein
MVLATLNRAGGGERHHMDLLGLALIGLMILIASAMLIGMVRALRRGQEARKKQQEQDKRRREQEEATKRRNERERGARSRQKQDQEKEQQRKQEQQRERQERERKSAPKDHSQAREWWDVLEVPRNAPIADAQRAYRLKMMQCHPDKVAGLAPEFIQLAEKKSRELNAALALAKQARR